MGFALAFFLFLSSVATCFGDENDDESFIQATMAALHASGNPISRDELKLLIDAGLIRKTRTPSEIWGDEVRLEILDRLEVHAHRTIKLPNNHGYLHEFPNNFWLLGEDSDTVLSMGQLGPYLNPTTDGRFLKIHSHTSRKLFHASGYGDSHNYAPLSPEKLIEHLQDAGVNFHNFEAIILSGCTNSNPLSEKPEGSLAHQVAELSGRPTFGTTTIMAYSGYLTTYIVPSERLVHFSLRLETSGVESLSRLEAESRKSFIEPCWRLHLPTDPGLTRESRNRLDEILNSFNNRESTIFYEGLYEPTAVRPVVVSQRNVLSSEESCARSLAQSADNLRFPTELFPRFKQFKN